MDEHPRFDSAPEGDELDQVLDRGLAFGFGEDEPAGASSGDTVISLLRRRSGLAPQVLLRDLHDATSPPVDPHSNEARAAATGTEDRYQILGEIAHGGVGVVLKGRDTDLGRDLAMKMLLEQHAADPAMLKRFVEEAQIGGQLQHPGVVPVYDMGLGRDRRPFFTMKLVQGRTLKAMLAARRDPGEDRRRFLGIFEKVLETMAYAHARGVIHRDLKPSNIMVGPYGEVQVMDWGLAKVMVRGDAAEAGSASPAAPTGGEARVETIRSGADDSRSETGSIMGTPAFMSPEQARGEVERLDERSDVFSLGAILCHVLTGEPPYTGRSPRAIRDRAAAADLGPALARLDGAALDRDLIAITRQCLATEPEARPRNAGEVAEAFATYLASVDERVHVAEVAAAEARGKAAEERRARRVTTTLSAALILALLTVAAILLWNERARSARRETANREADRALRDARSMRTEAETGDPADVVRWSRALESAKRAQALATSHDVAEASRTEAAAFLVEVEAAEQAARAATEQAAADRDLVRRLEEARVATAESWDMSGEFEAEAERHYAAAFRDHGFDFETAPVEELSRAIRASEVHRAIVGALLDWGEVRQRIAGRNADDAAARAAVKKVEAVLTAVAPDPVMIRMRDAFRRADVKALREVAESDEVMELPVAALEWLGNALAQRGDVDGAMAFLARAQRMHSGDYWINYVLGYWARRARPPRHETAARCHQAAAAIRPDSPSAWSSLGFVLMKQGAFEEAERAFRRALEARPDFAVAHFGLGGALGKRGRAEAAEAAFEAGFRLRPDSAPGRVNYGRMLLGMGKTDEAIRQLRHAVERHEGIAEVHYNLGVALAAAGRRAEAEAEYRKTIDLDAKHAQALNNLGAVLADTGRNDEAVSAFRRSIEADSSLPNPHLNLGREFIRRGASDPAEAALQRAVQLKSDWGEAYGLLGQIYFRQKRNARALAAAREATRCDPGNASHQNLLAKALDRLGQTDEAIAAAKRAIELDPESGHAYYTLSVILLDKRDVPEALKALQAAVRIDPGFTKAHLNIGYIFMQSGRADEALASFRAAVEADPGFADGWVNMGAVFERRGAYDEAVRAYRKAIAAVPTHATAHFNLGVALGKLGRRSESVAAFRTAARLNPSDAATHLSLGHALSRLGRLDEAKASVREAIRRAPRMANAHYVLGDIYLRDGARLEDSANEYRETLRLQPDHIGAHFKLGAMLLSQGDYREALVVLKRGRDLAVKRRMRPATFDNWITKANRRIGAEARLPGVVAGGESVSPEDRIDLARVAAEHGRPDVAVRIWRLVFATDGAEAKGDADRYEAATAAVRAAAKPAALGGTDSDTERVEWRSQALAWLRAEFEQRVAEGRDRKPAQLELLLHRFCMWKRDRSLASVRDPERLPLLPEDEREAWRSFWEDLSRVVEESREQLEASR